MISPTDLHPIPHTPADHLVPVLGIVGGIGSGKSTLARRLAERRPVLLLDGDAIGHDVLEEPQVVQRIQQRFGDDVLDERGRVDRARLGGIVFGETPAARSARRDLEAITHPRIRARLEQRIHETRRTRTREAVVLDAAVLFEAGWNDLCDFVVFVETPWETRCRRVLQSRQWGTEELRRREASQLPLEQKRNLSHEVLHNDDSLEDADRRLETILDRLIQDARA